MTKYAKHLNKRNQTPQTEKADKNQVANSAGGYSFALSPMNRLERFLILGSEGGSYYASERKATIENAKCVLDLIKSDGVAVVNKVVEISDQGRAPKNDPAIFVLALCAAHGDKETKKEAFKNLSKVCRIGTHLFQFASSVDTQRGWGRSLREGIANWYNEKSSKDLAFQLVKYKQRDGWSHRDLLRKSHPNAEGDKDALFKIATLISGNKDNKNELIDEAISSIEDEHTRTWLGAVRDVGNANDKSKVVDLIHENNLPREVIPTEFQNDPAVQEALLEKMPPHALLRNLGNLGKSGLLKPLSNTEKRVVEKIGNHEHLCKRRVHPIAVLMAQRIYGSGHGMRGSGAWQVCNNVVEALEEAFYGTFKGVEPSGKRTLIALDVSGSMGGGWSGWVAGIEGFSPREASAAMSMVTIRKEPQYHTFAFTDRFEKLNLTKKDSLESAVDKTSRMNFGRTDCSLPMKYALDNNIEVDTFIVYTDNETYAGSAHPHERLKTYRERTGINAKLIVVGMVSNGFTIADPNDPGMLDVVGFDSSAPQVMAEFSKGTF